jgi:hypothetical protein
MRILKNIWYWIVGHPAQLTYWFEGRSETLQVRKFDEIKPNHIAFWNVATEKRIVVKSDQPIKYIIREE